MGKSTSSSSRPTQRYNALSVHARTRASERNALIALKNHDPEESALRIIQKDLNRHNSEGTLVSFCKVKGDWTPWFRPLQVHRNGTFRVVAPSGFHNVQDLVYPQCPHSLNPFRTIEDTTMSLHHKGSKFTFEARGHSCQFILHVRSLGKANYILNEDELAQHMDDGTPFDPEEDEEDHETSSQFDAEIARQLPFGSPSTSATSVDAYLQGGSSPSPSPSQPLQRHLKAPGGSFFSAEEAAYRANPDFDMILQVLEQQKNGVFVANPSRHPAFDSNNLPLSLAGYVPRGMDDEPEHLPFLFTRVGEAVREYNSTVGVSNHTITFFLTHAVACEICSCTFSEDGYHAHLSDGCCMNMPGLSKVLSSKSRTPYFWLPHRTYSSATIPPAKEYLNTVIGRAFCDWNSRIGVPRDVWILITTSVVYCPECRLTRSFDGDAGHRNAAGFCEDIGQEINGGWIIGKEGPAESEDVVIGPLAMVLWKK